MNALIMVTILSIHSKQIHLTLVSLSGILTTPQLHYIVRCINTDGAFGRPTEDGYYLKLITAFNKLLPKVCASANLVARPKCECVIIPVLDGRGGGLTT